MGNCDNCGKETDARMNLEGEVLCSENCQLEYGFTSLFSLMTHRLPDVPKGTKIMCFNPVTGRHEIVEV